MTTIAISDKYLQRYAAQVQRQHDLWVRHDKALSINTRNVTGSRLECSVLIAPMFVGSAQFPIFSMHKSQHKLFYAIVAKLRDVLAKLLNPVTIAKYNDALASADSDWPAQLYTPVVKPLSAVADKTVLSDLSKKSNDKYAKVTAAIMANDKPVKQPTGFGGKAMKSLNKSHSRGVEINSVYRDSLRQTVREAGI